MTRSEIQAFFRPGVQIWFADATYAKPTNRWLTENFWTWFAGWRKEMGLMTWTRRNDCDNFARAYAQAAQDCHALTLQRLDEEAEGLLVGEFFYYSQELQGFHAIVCAITETGLTFIEPQNNRRLILTDFEKNSCFFVRF